MIKEKKYTKMNIGFDCDSKRMLLSLSQEYNKPMAEIIRMLLKPRYAYSTLNKLIEDGF